MFSTAAALLALSASASAHTIFQELYVEGESAGHTVGIRVPENNGPITDIDSNDIICNGGVNPYRQPVSTEVIMVPAGSNVAAVWHATLSGANATNPADPLDPSHKGPIVTYLAKIANATQDDVTGLEWFKIQEDGLDTSDGTWGSDRMIANEGKVNVTVPACVEDGSYLLRQELIALHTASSYPGVQLYMECAQIQITGGGSTVPPETASFPGAYSATDPGITIDITQNLTEYPIPGPKVFSC